MVLRISWVVVNSPGYRSGKVCRDGQLDSHVKLVNCKVMDLWGSCSSVQQMKVAGKVETGVKDGLGARLEIYMIVRASSAVRNSR